MKNKIKYLIFIIVALISGCAKSEQGTLRIDSLSVDGTEFYCFQRIKMWMCVESDNLGIADYKWGADGGEFTEGQGFSEALWVPPGTPGVYEVWCTVTVGKNTETRRRKMNVSHYFFDYFEGPTTINISAVNRSRPITWTNSGTAFTLSQATKSATFRVNSATAATGYVQRAFDSDPDLRMPFSCMSTIGWNARMPADSVLVGTASRGPAAITYQFNLDRDPDLSGAFVSQINFSWYPRNSATTNDFPLDQFGSGESCNGVFRYVVNNSGILTTYQQWFYHPALEFEAEEHKNVAVNISSDFRYTAYVDGALVFETGELNDWRSANGYTGNFYLTNWRIIIPSVSHRGTEAPAESAAPIFYLANTMGINNGTTFTGSTNDIP